MRGTRAPCVSRRSRSNNVNSDRLEAAVDARSPRRASRMHVWGVSCATTTRPTLLDQSARTAGRCYRLGLSGRWRSVPENGQ
jgi:hypothetical protein